MMMVMMNEEREKTKRISIVVALSRGRKKGVHRHREVSK